MGLGVATFIVALFLAATWWQSNEFADRASKEAELLADSDQEHIAAGVLQVVKTQDEVLVRAVQSYTRVFKDVIEQKGKVSFGEPVTWDVTNQLTRETSRVTLPKILIGGEWLGQITDPAKPVAIVDKVKKIIGEGCTFFQRMNEQGDMLRVASSISDQSGKRIIGTYIPARRPDGTMNAVIESVLNKQTYVGSAFVVDNWNLTAYEPLLDANGRVIGMYSPGLKRETAPALRKGLESVQVGKRGFVMAFATKDKFRGQVMVSPGSKEDGKNMLDAKDLNGKPYVSEILERAPKLKDGEIAMTEYVIELGGKPELVEAWYTYYKPWDWVIVTNGIKSDFEGFVRSVESGRKQMTGAMVLLGLFAAAAAAGLYAWFARKLSTPIKKLVEAAEAIGEGDLSPISLIKTRDEVGQLAHAFEKMHASLSEAADVARAVGDGDLSHDFHAKSERDMFGASIAAMLYRLRELVSRLAGKARETAQQSDQLSAAAADSSRTAADIASSLVEVTHATEESAKGTDEIARGNQQLASSAQEARESMARLREAMKDVQAGGAAQDEASNTAAEVATKGSQAVEHTMRSIERIQQQVASAAASVQDLGAKQAEIGSIVSTIDEITSQVNLLALNAAIEAARAGEAGRGFAVVAEEVRHLAERASSATHEIAVLISAIQDRVVNAVSAATASSAEVDEGVKHGTAAHEALANITEAVSLVRQTISANNDSVNQMMEDGAVVTGAIESVAAVSAQTAAAAEELGASTEEIFASATVVSESVAQQQETVRAVDAMAEGLRREAESLQELVAAFKLPDDGSEPHLRIAA